MSAANRSRVEFTRLDENRNPLGSSIRFDYEYPFIDISFQGRNVTLEPIGREPVVQYMGPELREIMIQGHCYHNEATFIDSLSEDGYVRVISDRWSGDGIVNSAMSSATGEGGGPRGGVEHRLYEYNLSIYEVTGNRPTSVSG